MSGNKQELVDRLLAADNTALLDDDLDQDEQISEEAIKAAEEELQKQTDLKLSDDPSPAKKIKISAEVRVIIETLHPYPHYNRRKIIP